VATKSDIAKALGLSPGAVTRAIQTGRLTPAPDGTFPDLPAAVAEYRAKTRPRVTHVAKEAAAGRYALARATREEYLARIAELKAKMLHGQLVRVDDVQAGAADAGSVLRTALENLPDQLAPILAPIGDYDRVRAILSERFEEILVDIANRLDQTIRTAAQSAAFEAAGEIAGVPADAQ